MYKTQLNRLDFSLTRKDNIICQRFFFINKDITDFEDAKKILDNFFDIDENGTYTHSLKINFKLLEKKEIIKEQVFIKYFKSNSRVIDIREGIEEIKKLFKN